MTIISSLPMTELTTVGFYFSTFLCAVSSLLLFILYWYRWSSDRLSLAIWLTSYFFVGSVVWFLTGHLTFILITIGFNFLALFALQYLIPITSLFGLFFLISLIMPFLYGTVWFLELIYIANQSFSHPLLSLLLWMGAAIFTILILTNTAIWSWLGLVRYSKLYFRFPRLRKAWEKAEESSYFHPWISIHVPCCSEPPKIVIETLNSLKGLQYPHFEVIVIDNNTQDPSLWQPVEEHCRQLGKQFRFYHFDRLEGAKSGALNVALSLSDPQVEIISVIDADYIVEPDFLNQLVRFLEDPQVGFVQSSQNYRDWKSNCYLSACYFEYQTHFQLEFPGLNEWNVNYTMGVLCLIRRKALEEAGGWAKWCLTEDSEIAIRLHALGYTGHYLKNTFGYGLIPETFESYKQQRFRWSIGPVQELQKYWRLYLPWHKSGLTFTQKCAEFFHGLLDFFSEPLTLLFVLPLLIVGLWFHIQHHHIFVLPPVILWLIMMMILQNIMGNWIRIRLLGGSWKEGFLSFLAARSLIYIKSFAFYKAWFSENLAWQRTDKFKVQTCFWRVLSSSKEEIICGMIYLLILANLFPFVSFQQPNLIFLVWLVILNQTFSFFCAPLMAFLSETSRIQSTTSISSE